MPRIRDRVRGAGAHTPSFSSTSPAPASPRTWTGAQRRDRRLSAAKHTPPTLSSPSPNLTSSLRSDTVASRASSSAPLRRTSSSLPRITRSPPILRPRRTVPPTAAAPPTLVAAPLPSLAHVTPSTGAFAGDVWSSLTANDIATSVLTADAARLLLPREELALQLTPASHLVQKAHGSSDLVVARTASQVLWSSVKKKTREKYAGHILAFLRWCDELGVPCYYRFPTASNILLLYLRKDMRVLRASTIDQRTHALAWWHKVQRMPWSLERKEQKAFQRAIQIESLPPLEKRRPVRLNDLVVISRASTGDDRAHIAVAAAALFAFFAMCRPGEFTVRSAANPHEDRPRWTSLLEQPSVAPEGPTSLILALPSEKVRGKAGFDRIVSQQRHLADLCPVAAVRRHMAINAPRPDEPPETIGSFSYVGSSGARCELTEGFFSRTVNAWLLAAGREAITGHCFRIGGATLFFAANKPLDEIRTRGGWQSDTYLTYIRDNYVRQAATFGDLPPDGLFYG
ncbi:hypothetical protein CF326_g7261 [Tilletia indica]|nr:hypothetical protein CF326_g7261 [Tilletia indica]